MYDKSMISMREKLAQMFIMGLEGENLSGKNLISFPAEKFPNIFDKIH